MLSFFRAFVFAVVVLLEEAIYNSLVAAISVTSRGGTVEALPVVEVLGIPRAHRAPR